MDKKKKINLYDIGMIGLIIVALFSTSKFGVSFSWIAIPAGCILAGACMGKIKFLDMHLYAVLFYLVAVLSTLVSPVVKPQRDVLSFFLLIGLFIVLTGNVESKEKSMIYIKTYILVGIVGCLVIIYNFSNEIYYNQWFHRSTIVVGEVSRDPNYVSAFIAPVPILMLMFKPIKNKLYNIVLIFLIFIAMILDGSRGGLISALLPLIFFFFFKIKGAGKKIGTFLIIAIIVILVIILGKEFLPEQTIERLLMKSTDADNRTTIWKAALGAFWDSPIIGQGIGSSIFYSMSGAQGYHSHNLYIDILSTGGILGALFYLLVLFKATIGKTENLLNMLILAIPFFLPQLFINGFNTMTMYLPIFMIHYCKIYLDRQVDLQQET